MERSWYYRVVLYSLLTLLAFVVLLPTATSWRCSGKKDVSESVRCEEETLPAWFRNHVQRKVQPGLDLQGGLHLVYEVQVDKAISDKADRLASEIEEKLKKD